MEPIARKYPLGKVPSDREEWLRLSLEDRLRAVFALTLFFAEIKPLDEVTDPRFPPASEKIAPVVRKRALSTRG